MSAASRRIAGDGCIPKGRELLSVAIVVGATGTGGLIEMMGAEEARRIKHSAVPRGCMRAGRLNY